MIERWIIIDDKWRHIVISDEIVYVDGKEAMSADPRKANADYLKAEGFVLR